MNCKCNNNACPNEPIVCGECYAAVQIEAANLESDLSQLRAQLEQREVQLEELRNILYGPLNDQSWADARDDALEYIKAALPPAPGREEGK